MNTSKKDIIWSYLSRFLMIGVNVILLPLIMRFLTSDELGLWYVFSSISQIVNLFDFGFNATISRHMTYAWSGASKLEKTYMTKEFGNKKNVRLMSEIMYTCRLVYFIISVLAFAIMISFGTIYICSVTKTGMTREILIAWIVYVSAVFLNLFYGYWSSLLQGIGAVAERNKMNVIAKVIQVLLAAIFLFYGMGLLGFVIAYTISGISLRIIGRKYFKKKTSEFTFESKISKGRIKECFSAIWESAWRNGIVMLAEFFTTQANTLICAYFIDLTSTSVYGVLTQVISTIASVSTAYFSAYQPQYSNACLQRNVDLQRNITCKADFIYKLVFTVGMIAFIFLGIPILDIIRPNMNISITLSLFVGLFYYLYHQQSIFVSMIASSNRILCCKSYMVTAVCSFFLSIFLVTYAGLGIWGIIISQLVTNLFYNNWKWPNFVLRETNLRYRDIYLLGIRELKNDVTVIVSR